MPDIRPMLIHISFSYDCVEDANSKSNRQLSTQILKLNEKEKEKTDREERAGESGQRDCEGSSVVKCHSIVKF